MAYLKYSELFRLRGYASLLYIPGSGSAHSEAWQLSKPAPFCSDEARAVEVIDGGRVLHRLAIPIASERANSMILKFTEIDCNADER